MQFPESAQWITLLIVIAGFLYQEIRLSRQRKWDKEDRVELAKKVVTEAERVATHIASESQRTREELAVNTRISEKAFYEANSINEKIRQLGLDQNAIMLKRGEDRILFELDLSKPLSSSDREFLRSVIAVAKAKS